MDIQPQVASRYVDLFRRREFCALWTGSALGVAAGTVAGLSLGTLIYAQTGSPLLASAAMFGPSLVQLAGAGTLMSAADTVRPRHALTAVCVATTIGLALQAALPLAPWVRLLVALAVAFAMSIGNGVRWGLLAEVLPQGQYALARSAMNISVGVMQVLGFAIGGSLLRLLPVEQVLWVAAALAAVAVPITWTGVSDRRARRTGRAGLRETWRGNRALLTLPSTRPLLIALTVPNGLIAGCEALFVPYAGDAAAALFVAGAAGMLLGDVMVGRVLSGPHRRASATWLRWWLAVPFLFFALRPGTSLAALLAGCACIGYAATLAQQEMLVELTPPHLSGQVLGAESAARATCQGFGALLAGALAEGIAPGVTIALLGVVSLLVSAALTRPLVRATQTRPIQHHWTVGTMVATTARRP
ncbi:MFS transporter [Aeromicrobium sp. 9AM]|uniref:MFS transporter n=1 Tax=Aeromicrobium sp. 9AM TaxID=2653126 RepID=UPI0012F246F3|nr:MFS transporter [Aeromicrobium sp. 9AM]VXC28404.1 Predicted arabinose efflux permease, MFS family [Aeromicrobium sp. 9AM]